MTSLGIVVLNLDLVQYGPMWSEKSAAKYNVKASIIALLRIAFTNTFHLFKTGADHASDEQTECQMLFHTPSLVR